jgi:hypothetical protein
MTFDFFVPHDEEGRHDDNPVQVVRKYRSVRGRVFPAEDGVEKAPSTSPVYVRAAALHFCELQSIRMIGLGATHVDMPDCFVYIVRTGAST